MHRLLARQLKRHFGDQTDFPHPWPELLEAVDDAYSTADSHRELLERSLVLSSEELHQANAEMRAIFQAIPDLLFRLERDGTILDLQAGNDADLLRQARDLVGRKIQDIPDSGARAAFRDALERVASSHSTYQIEYGLAVNGKPCFYEARFVPFLDGGQVVVIVQNITLRKQGEALIQERAVQLQQINSELQLEIERRFKIEEQLRHDASHDRLTGLPNRGMLMDRVEHCIRLAKRDPHYQFAVLFIDVDDFKRINDTFGHKGGDDLLVGIGERLMRSIRAVDTASRPTVASRLGGDEFVLLLGGIASQSDAMRVVERIQKLMEEPLLLEQQEVVANLSIGMAFGEPSYERAAEIVRAADQALYRAKREGKHRLVTFSPDMCAAASNYTAFALLPPLVT